jgi:outer membrane protein
MGGFFFVEENLCGDSMNRPGWSQACVSAAVSLVVGLTASGARAESSDDSLSLKIASALRSDRLFVRAGVIFAKIKTKSGDTKDVTGPVMTVDDIKNLAYTKGFTDADLLPVLAKYPSINWNASTTGGTALDVLYNSFTRDSFLSSNGDPDGALLNKNYGLPLLTNELSRLGLNGIGTPPGIKGKAGPETGTAGISLGYYLTDDHDWVVETYVLAAPLSTSVTVHGQVPKLTDTGASAGSAVKTDSAGNVIYKPIAIDGQKIITSKLLPPLVMFGRYWGPKTWALRPYTGAMGMYAIFYDTKATQTLNSYVGGSNPGDTTVSIKNTGAFGPVLGVKYDIDDSWHASLNIGHVKLKTVATLTTRNTSIKSGDAIINDLGSIAGVINTGEGVYGSKVCSVSQDACDLVRANGGLTSLVTKALADERGGSLGTYVRKTETELTNTIFMLSVGRTF